VGVVSEVPGTPSYEVGAYVVPMNADHCRLDATGAIQLRPRYPKLYPKELYLAQGFFEDTPGDSPPEPRPSPRLRPREP